MTDNRLAGTWTRLPKFCVSLSESSEGTGNLNRIKVLSDKMGPEICAVLLDTCKTHVLHLRVFRW